MINLPLYLLCGCMHASVWVLERSHTHIFLNGLNFVGANIKCILVNIPYLLCVLTKIAHPADRLHLLWLVFVILLKKIDLLDTWSSSRTATGCGWIFSCSRSQVQNEVYRVLELVHLLWNERLEKQLNETDGRELASRENTGTKRAWLTD